MSKKTVVAIAMSLMALVLTTSLAFAGSMGVLLGTQDDPPVSSEVDPSLTVSQTPTREAEQAAEPQVAESQVAESQMAESQVAEPQVAEPQVAGVVVLHDEYEDDRYEYEDDEYEDHDEDDEYEDHDEYEDDD
jgi:hypothetical protein